MLLLDGSARCSPVGTAVGGGRFPREFGDRSRRDGRQALIAVPPPLDPPLPGASPRTAALRLSLLGAGFARLPKNKGGSAPLSPPP